MSTAANEEPNAQFAALTKLVEHRVTTLNQVLNHQAQLGHRVERSECTSSGYTGGYQQRQPPPQLRACFNCGGFGHFAQRCPQPNTSLILSKATNFNSHQSIDRLSQHQGHQLSPSADSQHTRPYFGAVKLDKPSDDGRSVGLSNGSKSPAEKVNVIGDNTQIDTQEEGRIGPVNNVEITISGKRCTVLLDTE